MWGNPDKIICSGDLNSNLTSREVSLLTPWMNNGKFFSLPLVQNETFILGKREKLEPFSKVLSWMGAKYVYVENLTDEQKKFFNCLN